MLGVPPAAVDVAAAVEVVFVGEAVSNAYHHLLSVFVFCQRVSRLMRRNSLVVVTVLSLP